MQKSIILAAALLAMSPLAQGAQIEVGLFTQNSLRTCGSPDRCSFASLAQQASRDRGGYRGSPDSDRCRSDGIVFWPPSGACGISGMGLRT